MPMKKRNVLICSIPFILAVSFLIGRIALGQPASIHSEAASKSTTEEFRNIVMGFSGNRIESGVVAATISGGGRYGFPNRVYGDMGSIGGGAGNECFSLGTVAGGKGNVASGIRTTIGGGESNAASRDSATIGGGWGNSAAASHSTIAGGISNSATEIDATVGGGSGNVASERHSTVGGGSVNKATGFAAVIAGGVYNSSSATYATVGGGIANLSSGIESTVNGGAGNHASGEGAFVGGGMNNHATTPHSTVGGGRANVAGNGKNSTVDGAYATVGGGMENTAGGSFSVVPGGYRNSAAGNNSFAAGSGARVNPEHDGVFLYSDHKDIEFSSSSPNEFAARATGGVRFVTGIDSSGSPLAGVRIRPGSGSWETLSDRHVKTAFSPVDGREILERLKTVPILSWRYRTEDLAARHIGPTAQDFHHAFQMGADERYINSVDADGIAMAAIQSLYDMMKERDRAMEAQEKRIRELEEEIAAQKRFMAELETRFQGTKAGDPAR
jgi:hypothetical protein